jgi:hypothetical protein
VQPSETSLKRGKPDVRPPRVRQLRVAERRRHRYPVPVDDPPPLERPVSTLAYGIVAFTGSTGEIVEDFPAGTYDDIIRDRDLMWATWRSPMLQELVETWPARSGPSGAELSRGWWQPTKAELVEARRAAKSRERRRTDV